MTPQHHFRRRFGYPGSVPYYSAPYPVVVASSSDDSCDCKAGSDIERKIKENPLISVIAALFVGYLIAKKR